MIKLSVRKSFEPMSSHERLVNEALFTLNSKYELVQQPENILFDLNESSNPVKYRPDFEITNDSGNKLFIEVKSESSMSLPNMVNFIKIDQAIRREPNKGFLILVFSDHVGRFATRPEFQKLHIEYVKGSFDVLEAVEAGFKRSFG